MVYLRVEEDIWGRHFDLQFSFKHFYSNLERTFSLKLSRRPVPNRKFVTFIDIMVTLALPRTFQAHDSRA